MVLENSFGPETSNFPQPMRLEHYDGTDFTDSLANSCESFDPTKISLSNISLDPALTSVLGASGNFINGQTQGLGFQATGRGNQGQIGVTYDSYDWLRYDWDDDGDYDDNPNAVATFGLFRGDDRLIHWREAF
jgi:MSHA biogenesis protein MshQ